MSQQTVTINGTEYDIHTGLPIKKQQSDAMPAPSSHTQASQTVHQQLQKSQTLNRRVVKKHVATPAATSSVQKSPAITKFAPHPVGAKQPVRTFSDIGPVAHPSVQKAEQQRSMQQPQTNVQLEPKPSQVIKQEAITQAMNNAPKRNSQKAPKQQGKMGRMASFGSIAIALILLGGYFAYINMPNLSVRVAAAQAGVNASYPEYRPDGYSLSGAVAYTEGQVNMKFASNTGPQNFTIQQSKSTWDSSAVLNNYIEKKAGDNYITYNERGLTIYTYGSNAAWVNKGVLYTITGDAPLSSDQIRRIATSM
jgi:hypothetical protein